MRRPRRLGLALVVMVSIATAMAGCSSSGSSSTTGSSSSTSAASSVVTIGSLDTFTGELAGGLAGAQQTEQAWVQWTNAHGGVAGHPVKLIALDDAGSGPTTLENAKQLVEQDHVVALVANMTIGDTAVASYVDSVKIPLIGGVSNNDSLWQTNPYYFPQGQTTGGTLPAQLVLAKQKGYTKFGYMYCAEIAACEEAVPVLKSYAASVGGISLAYSGGISSSAPSYTAPCLAAKAAGVQALEVGDAALVVSNVASSCAAQGYKPLFVQAATSVNTTILSNPALTGLQAMLTNFPWIDSSTPATQAYQAALKQYEPSVLTGAGYGSASTEAWASLQLFKAAAEAVPAGEPLTTANILQGLWSLKNETLGGLAPPLTFTQGKPAGVVACGFVIGISNGKWVEPEGDNTVCAPQ